jgi:hypothetical protein
LGVQVGAETVHHRDDCKRDTRCDQAVFNRGRTRLIGQELQEATLQTYLLLGNPVEATNTVEIPGYALRLNKLVVSNFTYNYAVSRLLSRHADVMRLSGLPARPAVQTVEYATQSRRPLPADPAGSFAGPAPAVPQQGLIAATIINLGERIFGKKAT